MIQSLIIAFIFLVVAGAVALSLNWWTGRFGSRSRALSKRFNQLNALRQDNPADLRAKNSAASASPVAALARRILGAGTLRESAQGSAKGDKDAARILFLSLIIGAATAALVLLLPFGSLPIALALGVITAAIPSLVLRRRAALYRRKLESQFPEALDFLSRALRAGHGLTSAIGMVAEELSDPVAQEFRTTHDEINFGLPFTEAISNLSTRAGSPDVDFFVVALLIQRETGGNLAELLESLSKTIRDRIKLTGKVRVISAEGRLSGVVISVIPFALALMLTLMNPKYMQPLWSTPAGYKLIAVGLTMMAIGIFWVTRIVRVRV